MIPVRDDNPTRTTPVVVYTLIAVNVAVFVYQVILSPEREALLINHWGLVPNRTIYLPRIWHLTMLKTRYGPIFASMFLHGSFWHLLGNMWTLWLFGDNIEDRMGPVRFIVFYVSCGVLAGLLHAVLHRTSAIPCIGASGAIAGVMGAYFLLFPTKWITVLIPVFILLVPVKLPAVTYLLFWIVTQFMGAHAGSSNIAFWAHIGGFAAGMFLIRRWDKQRQRRRGVFMR